MKCQILFSSENKKKKVKKVEEATLVSVIALDKRNIQLKYVFLISPRKHVVGVHYKCLNEALLLNTTKYVCKEK